MSPTCFRAAMSLAALSMMSPMASAAIAAHSTASADHTASAVTPAQALDRLMQGSARFVSHKATHPPETAVRMTEVAGGQHPIAVVLSCSDSACRPS